LKSLVGDFVEQTEEYIVDGEKGILIKYFHIDKKNGKKKIVFALNLVLQAITISTKRTVLAAPN
jgi:hypothetical protein